MACNTDLGLEITDIDYEDPDVERVFVMHPNWTLEDAQRPFILGQYPLGGDAEV